MEAPGADRNSSCHHIRPANNCDQQIRRERERERERENNYQHTTTCVFQSLNELKVSRDAHKGTEEELTKATA
jgi:hypothetical protein